MPAPPAPNPAQVKRARRLLAHEGMGDSADERAMAAGRVYDKLHAHLAPLLGSIGVELLLVRSAKLAQGEFAFLAEVSSVEGMMKLRDRLRQQAPAIAAESAEALFATFFTLLTTFIGERLTGEVLRNAWPTIEGTATGEVDT